MSITQDLAIKACKHGKPVTHKWMIQNGASRTNASACARHWVNSGKYDCEVSFVNGIKHYLMKSVDGVSLESKEKEYCEIISKLINEKGLTLPEVKRDTGFTLTRINRLIKKYDLRTKKLTKEDRSKIAMKGYETSKRKNARKHATIIEEYRNNSECLLWGVALGYNMGARA